MNPVLEDINSVIPDTSLEEPLEDLRYSIFRLSRELDVYTSREMDCPRVFEIAREIDLSLAAQLTILEKELLSVREPSPARLRTSAESLRDMSGWLQELVGQMARERNQARLPALLEHLSSQCRELASLLWWKWLASGLRDTAPTLLPEVISSPRRTPSDPPAIPR